MMKPLLARLALCAFLAAPVLALAATPAVLRFDAGQLQSAARAGFRSVEYQSQFYCIAS